MQEVNVIQKYQAQERKVFAAIPGMDELIHAEPSAQPSMEEKYPEAAFALHIANNLFNHDRELSLINQRAYFSL